MHHANDDRRNHPSASPVFGEQIPPAGQQSGNMAAFDEEARENLVGFFELLLDIQRRADDEQLR